MTTFQDSTSRVWCVTVNIAAVKRVRAGLDIDLLDIADGSIIDRLANDPVCLVDVLYLVCKPQADAAGVTDEGFGESMSGAALDAGSSALLKELVDFFPDPRRRDVLKKVLAKSEEVRTSLMTQALAEVEKIDASHLAATLSTASATNSPASSD